jgi:hypothetical protein
MGRADGDSKARMVLDEIADDVRLVDDAETHHHRPAGAHGAPSIRDMMGRNERRGGPT